MYRNLNEIVLTCASWQEAQRIADALLEKKLVTSIETFEVKPKDSYANHLHDNKEINLIVIGSSKNYDKIEAEAARQQKSNSKPVLLKQLTR